MADELHIRSGIKNYSICFSSLREIKDLLRNTPGTICVADARVFDLHGSALGLTAKDNPVLLKISEKMKNLDSVNRIYDEVMRRGVKKNSVLVSIGGGITQDVTGFAASTIFRGIKWFYIPTTLLAQADSCMGSKTSLNYKTYKNLLGTFYPPDKILICPGLTGTLSVQDYYSGMGEVAKLAIMGGKKYAAELYADLSMLDKRDPATLEKHISRSLRIKKSFISGDEFDRGKRNMLNFGHCYGHAIEAASGFRIPHGQAVVLGMMLAGRDAVKYGLLRDNSFNMLLLRAILKVNKREILSLSVPKIMAAMEKDKKRETGNLALIMTDDNYHMHKTVNLSHSQAQSTLNGFLKEYKDLEVKK